MSEITVVGLLGVYIWFTYKVLYSKWKFMGGIGFLLGFVMLLLNSATDFQNGMAMVGTALSIVLIAIDLTRK